MRGPAAQPQQPAPREDDRTQGVALPDELTLKHMAQDYGALKHQLLRLQTLLQVRTCTLRVLYDDDVYMSTRT